MPLKTSTGPKTSRTSKTSFSSSINVIIIESKGQYCKRVWLAIGAGISHLMIGATNMTVLVYSVIKDDAHAVLCCVGYQLFMVEAILSLNYANGWSNRLRLRHRIFAHICLQIFCLVCSIVGTVVVITSKGISVTVHCLLGLIALSLALANAVVGIIVVLKQRCKVIHMGFGIPTLLTSSICLASGIVLDAFRNWTGSVVTHLLLGFIVFYTAFISIFIFMKCMYRIK